MGTPTDRLYHIFENHLFNALVENESTEEFLRYVIEEYVAELRLQGTIMPEHVRTIKEDLQADVLDMLRKKIYGFYDLTEYRKAKIDLTQTKTPAKSRRSS
jgi:hypothetical protein